MTMTSRKFGIEIECFGMSMARAQEVINAAGVECHIEHYNHITRSAWKIVTDATVSDGFEVVSPILSGEDGLAQVRKVSAALVSAGAKVDRRCGFHVHVDARDLSGADLVSIVRRYSGFEEQIDAFMPRSRRQSVNTYCKSAALLLDLLRPMGNAPSAAQIRSRFQEREDRYYKVNLHAFMRHGTVEFRQHSGTVEARKMVPWIMFCLNLVESSRVQVVRESVRSEAGDQLRKNAIVKKFQKLAEALNTHTSRWDCVSARAIAEATGIAEESVPAYISQFRQRYGVRILARRGYGYFHQRDINNRTLVDIVGSAPQERVTTVAPTSTNMFEGLSQEVVSYFQERTMELSAA